MILFNDAIAEMGGDVRKDYSTQPRDRFGRWTTGGAGAAVGGAISDGCASNPVNGKDISGTFEFDSESDLLPLEQVIKAQGFDGLPTTTADPKEFISACKASDTIAFRAVGASDSEILESYDHELKHGEFYVRCSGGHTHGYGMYAEMANTSGPDAVKGVERARNVAQRYENILLEKGGATATKIYALTMDKNAKIGYETPLKLEMRKDTRFIEQMKAMGCSLDVGTYAALKGYDGYVEGFGKLNKSSHMVILNRSKLIIYDK